LTQERGEPYPYGTTGSPGGPGLSGANRRWCPTRRLAGGEATQEGGL